MTDYKYLFLDIDGVLNNPASRAKSRELGSKYSLCPFLLGNLKYLCTGFPDTQVPSIRIVLSTDWVSDHSDIVALRLAFSLYGLSIYDCCRLVDCSESKDSIILEYLLEEIELLKKSGDSISNVCIIDDLDSGELDLKVTLSSLIVLRA